MFTSETKIRVRYAETDQMRVVYHGHYFAYFETGRAEAIRSLGMSYADLEKAGIIMPVVEVKCKYLRPVLYDSLITVKVILNELPADHKITFHHEIYNDKQELLAAGYVTLFFMNATTMKRTAMPETLYKKLQPYFNEK